MKTGVNLINFGPSATPATFKRWAQMVEALGYHHLLISDHIAITEDVGARYPAPFYEPISTLGWLAGVTERISIGTTVLIVPYRSPLEVAKAFANIDQLSGGRLILGVGVGWAKEEFAALNVPFHRRGKMTDEYLSAIKALWTKESVSVDGEFITFKNVDPAPSPIQKPHPPIWVGGASEAAMRRAVQLGDGWHPIRFQMSWFRDEGIPRLREIADQAEKPMPQLCPRIKLRLTDTSAPKDNRAVGEGSIDQIRADMAMLAELGCAHVTLDTYNDNVEETRNVEVAWRMLSIMAEQALDLGGETVR
jgi:probable F420-dependent oxidoreductase